MAQTFSEMLKSGYRRRTGTNESTRPLSMGKTRANDMAVRPRRRGGGSSCRSWTLLLACGLTVGRPFQVP
eukprot:5753201-Pyramimonas_sp.AAC.2